MAGKKLIVGRGTVVTLAPLPECERIKPQETTFTVSAAGAAENATSIPITMTPAITRNIPASVTAPIYLNFVEANGKEHFVVVTAPITPASTSITVEAIPQEIAASATAAYPPILSNRTSVSISTNDSDQASATFDDNGWADGTIAMLGQSVDAQGNYSPLNAAWNTALTARLNIRECWLKVVLPPPTCDELYTKGHTIEGVVSISSMNMEIPSDNIITTPIGFVFRGEVEYTRPS